MRSRSRLVLVFGVATLVLAACQKADEAPAATSPVSSPSAVAAGFAPVGAIFRTNCVGCHGTENPKEGVSLVSYESVMKGGEHGPILVPGDPSKSLLFNLLRGTNGAHFMPPSGTPLTDAEVKIVEAWIQGGAKS